MSYHWTTSSTPQVHVYKKLVHSVGAGKDPQSPGVMWLLFWPGKLQSQGRGKIHALEHAPWPCWQTSTAEKGKSLHQGEGVSAASLGQLTTNETRWHRGLLRLIPWFHQHSLTLAAEFDTPWVTFLMRPPTFPYFISPVTPSETSFKRPMGLPRKSTDPRIRAAWLRSSCGMELGRKGTSAPVSPRRG